MPHQDRFLAYLNHYAAKQLDAIAAQFADNVTLRDWNISVSGKAAALAETAKNFAAARSVEIEVLRTYTSEQAVAGELRILVDGSIELFVVDVIEFDAAGQISSIRAYLGRGGAEAL